MFQLPDLSFSQQGGKHLENFYMLCVRNYAKTLTSLATDLQILSHWATSLAVVIHSVAKIASISGPPDAGLTLGENGWQRGQDVTSDQDEEMSSGRHPLVAQTIDRSAHHLTFFFSSLQIPGWQPCALHFHFKLMDRAWNSSQERFQDSPFWLIVGAIPQPKFKRNGNTTYTLFKVICNILETQIYNYLYP